MLWQFRFHTYGHTIIGPLCANDEISEGGCNLMGEAGWTIWISKSMDLVWASALCKWNTPRNEGRGHFMTYNSYSIQKCYGKLCRPWHWQCGESSWSLCPTISITQKLSASINGWVWFLHLLNMLSRCSHSLVFVYSFVCFVSAKAMPTYLHLCRSIPVDISVQLNESNLWDHSC